ncbi:MAG: hypothetical protein FVQ81_15335 [Candidatus Glassbacteria bacterium]|nr:hypothetical protein [Candidatus Glassbacteria bacterium]
MTRKLFRPALEWVENSLGVPVFPRDRILSAVSGDGVHWERRPGIVIDVKGEHGSEMVYWPHVVDFGNYRRMYFVGSHLVNGHWRERILSARAESGDNWEIEPGERVSPGGEFDSHFASSPRVVGISGGYRMYYSGKSSGVQPRILSAVSRDGLSWQKEPGVRLSPLTGISEYLSAPSVICDGSEWLMVFTSRFGYSARIGIARSEDGLAWSWTVEKGGDLINPGPRLCAANPSPVFHNGLYRVYYSGHDGSVYKAKIYFSDTRDFKTWSPGVECLDFSGPFERAEVEYCHVIRESELDWKMYYTGFWGKHLLSPITSYIYSRKAKAARAGLAADY